MEVSTRVAENLIGTVATVALLKTPKVGKKVWLARSSPKTGPVRSGHT